MNTTNTPRKSYYKPYKIPRRVRLESVTPGDVAVFKSKSMTDASSDEDRYHPSVDLHSGACRCDCNHFLYRLARHNPTVFSPPEHFCKHLVRCIATVERRGLLPQQQGQFSVPCIHCGSFDEDDYYPVADAMGEVVPGQFTCARCAHDRADNLSDVAEEL